MACRWHELCNGTRAHTGSALRVPGRCRRTDWHQYPHTATPHRRGSTPGIPKRPSPHSCQPGRCGSVDGADPFVVAGGPCETKLLSRARAGCSWADLMSPARAPMDPKRLRSLRERAGLTQHQLARAVGFGGAERVSRWESGRSTPRPGALGRIAEILDVPVETLLIAPADSATLREQRLPAGLTIAQLAEAVYVSSRTVVRWENGDFKSDVSRGM